MPVAWLSPSKEHTKRRYADIAQRGVLQQVKTPSSASNFWTRGQKQVNYFDRANLNCTALGDPGMKSVDETAGPIY